MDRGCPKLQRQRSHDAEALGNEEDPSVARERVKEGGRYSPPHAQAIKCQSYSRRGLFSIPHHIALPCARQLYYNTLNPQPSLSPSKVSFFNNDNFPDMNFGYPLGNDGFTDFAAQYNRYNPHLDSDAPISSPSMSRDWYLNPLPEGHASQSECQESGLLDASGSQFVDPCAYMEPAYGGFSTEVNVYGRNPHEQARNVPAIYAGPSAGAMVATPRLPIIPPTLYPLAPSSGPSTVPPIAPQPDIYNPPPISYAAETLPYDVYGQPLTDPSSASQWSYSCPTTSVDKGKTRATGPIPLHPTAIGDDAWWYQQPGTTENHGKFIPQTVLGVPPNTAPIDPSSGPQRSAKGAKWKGKATSTGRGRRKRTEPLSVDIDSSWEQTADRLFRALLDEYVVRPNGGPINPEAAFANIKKHITEDLHRSPGAGQPDTENADKESRAHERYLTHILREVRRSANRVVRNETSMFAQVLEELSDELMPMNTGRVLRGGGSRRNDPSEQDNSDKKVRRRKAERDRRGIIRDLFHQVSAFFLVKGKVSGADVVLFAIIYLMIGEIAFPGRIRPHTPDDRQ